MQISGLAFIRQFEKLKERIELSIGGEFTSFRKLPPDWEEYKVDVRDEARRRLGDRRWVPREIGTGVIIDRTIDAIEIFEKSPPLRNNLVSWLNAHGPTGQSHRALLRAKVDASANVAIEQQLYALFKGGEPEGDVFDALTTLLGRRYDLLAYLFYLKDADRFMPIAPTTFDEAFESLGLALKTSRRCSWSNYVQYNFALHLIKDQLDEVIEDNQGARLIDAHSFCWMLVNLKLPPLPELEAPLPVRFVLQGKALSRSVTAPLHPSIVTDEDFQLRDERKRKVGRLAQEWAMRSEHRRLRELGHRDPTGAVVDVSMQPSKGYDLASQELNGDPRYIEVKAVRRSKSGLEFFVTRNELAQSLSLPNYFFYLVFNAASFDPQILWIEGRELAMEFLTPTIYQVALPGVA